MTAALTRFAVWLSVMVLKALSHLPDSWKIALTGGKSIVLAGRTLDPDMQVLHTLGRRGRPVHTRPVEEVQASVKLVETLALDDPEPGASWRDFTIPSAGKHQIPVRLYTPEQQDLSLPVMTFFHQGGGVIGGFESSHVLCTILAATARLPVLSVDYRLAPQHPYPAGLNDCLDAYDWTLKHAAEFRAPAGQVAVGGDSMGGHFAAVIAQEARRLDLPLPDLQLLIYPMTDATTSFGSAETFKDMFPLTRETMDWFEGHYLKEGENRDVVQLQPALEPNLEGLPPAIIATAGFDVLVDDGAAYARKLKEAGVQTTYRCFEGMLHGFTSFTAFSPAARDACDEIACLVRQRLTGG